MPNIKFKFWNQSEHDYTSYIPLQVLNQALFNLRVNDNVITFCNDIYYESCLYERIVSPIYDDVMVYIKLVD